MRAGCRWSVMREEEGSWIWGSAESGLDREAVCGGPAGAAQWEDVRGRMLDTMQEEDDTGKGERVVDGRSVAESVAAACRSNAAWAGAALPAATASEVAAAAYSKLRYALPLSTEAICGCTCVYTLASQPRTSRPGRT